MNDFKELYERADAAGKSEVAKLSVGTIHKFESAGLGKAPFNCVGIERKVYQACHGAPIQPGDACDYCGTGISYLFQIVSADGKRFVVGSDCVSKTGDAGLKKVVSEHERKIRQAKSMEKAVDSKTEIDAVISDVRLKEFPHPMGYKDRQTGAPLTLLDYAKWMALNAGTSGRLKALRVIKKVLKGTVE